MSKLKRRDIAEQLQVLSEDMRPLDRLARTLDDQHSELVAIRRKLEAPSPVSLNDFGALVFHCLFPPIAVVEATIRAPLTSARHHPAQHRDIGSYSPAWCDQATTGRLSGFRSSCRGGRLWSA